MPSLKDPVIDELQNNKGNVFISRAPSQGWLRPERVTLNTPVLQHTLGEYLGRPELEFVLHHPQHRPPPRALRVRPKPEILQKFLCLGSGSDEEIHDFASKFGPLLIFCSVDDGVDFVVVESCDVWRYFAACMRSFLRIAASFHAGRVSDPVDWATIGNCPPPVNEAKDEPVDPLGALPISGGKAWKLLIHFVRQGTDRNRAMWARLLNVLLELGRVRPWLLWEGTGSDARPRLVFSGPNLLSYLALQLCLLASKQDAFAVCSYCNQQYSSKRAPKAGQRNFCPACRESGVPVRVAQRSRRKSLREGVANQPREGMEA